MKNYQLDMHFVMSDRKDISEVIEFLNELIKEFFDENKEKITEDVERENVQGWIDLIPTED